MTSSPASPVEKEDNKTATKTSDEPEKKLAPKFTFETASGKAVTISDALMKQMRNKRILDEGRSEKENQKPEMNSAKRMRISEECAGGGDGPSVRPVHVDSLEATTSKQLDPIVEEGEEFLFEDSVLDDPDLDVSSLLQDNDKKSKYFNE